MGDTGADELRDTVDVERFDGNVWKMILGSVNPWFDNDESDDEESDDEREEKAFEATGDFTLRKGKGSIRRK